MMKIIKLIHKKLFSRSSSLFMNKNRKYSKYPNLKIGDWTYGQPQIRSRRDGGTLKIGKFCSFAPGVKIFLGREHRTDWITTYPFNAFFKEVAPYYSEYSRTKGDVIIGNDAWIATDAIILSGVEIGNGAVIGARSVVTKDVAPYSIVAGNPAKFIRFRFDEETINNLQEIAWWNWPMSKIRESWPLLISPDIELFISKYKK
jgi:acetyltransferase-like isoleucine patch superfamily enzyme